jgi:hypothetical protein
MVSKYELNLTDEQEQVGFIIDKTNRLEFEIKQIITSYIKPKKDKRCFVHDILLHSQVITLGSKIKVFTYICKKERIKLNYNNYHTLLTFRNAFAHADTVKTNIDVNLDKNGKIKQTEIYMTIDKLSQSGKFTPLRRDKMFYDFVKLSDKISNEIVEIKKKLNES